MLEPLKEQSETIQEIAVKLLEGQFRTLQTENGPKERTVFILGSTDVGKSTVINKFFDREDHVRHTLALEYSYGRRTSPSQHVLNIWELGALDNAEDLIEVPLYLHGVEHFAAIIMLDLSQPQSVWPDLIRAYRGLKTTCEKLLKPTEYQTLCERMAERVRKEHHNLERLELMPFHVVIVGGKYDLYKDFDPARKQQICRCLRAMAHLIGAGLLFYSSKIPKLAKTLRDTISHLGFGSPTNPFRVHTTDFNDALSIWFGTDSWERIADGKKLSVEQIGNIYAAAVPNCQDVLENKQITTDPAKDPGFRESIIDEMRAQKEEELRAIIRESQMRGQFERITS